MPFDGGYGRRRPGAFPYGAARIRLNQRHPLAAGILGLWALGRGGAPLNLVTGEMATALGTPTHAPGVAGPAWTNNGSAQGWEVRNGTLISGRTEWTIASVCAIPTGATTAGGGRAIYAERASSGNDITKLDFGPNNTTNAAVVWRNTAGNLINPSPSGDSRTSRQSIFSASMSWVPNTTTVRVYIGGGLSRTDTVGASNVTQSNASKRATIGYDYAVPSSSNLIGDIALVAVLEPAWSAEQHALFALDPWALLAEAPTFIGRRGAGGTAVTANIGLGSVEFTGLAPTVSAAVTADIGLGAVEFAGLPITVTMGVQADIGLGVVEFTGLAPTVTAAVTAEIGLGVVEFTGLQISVAMGVQADIGLGVVEFTGLSPTVTAAVTAEIGLGAVEFTGLQITVTTSDDVTADIGLGVVEFAGLPITVSMAVTASIGLGRVVVTGLPVTVAWAGWLPVPDPAGEWSAVPAATGDWTPVASPSGGWTPV